MSNSNLTKLLDKAALNYNGTRIQRLCKAPKKLIYSKVLALISQLLDRPFMKKVKTFWDEDMLVVIPEIVSLAIYRNKFFEEGLTRMVLKYLKPGMTFIDIGAHFGYFTMLSSLLVENEGQVHSFEPTPSTFDILKANALDKENVLLNNCGVSDKRKITFLNDCGIRYSAYNSYYDLRLPTNVISKLKIKKYEIENISIDDYVENKSLIPDFIKIDAESAEYEILLGMETTISRYSPMISIEVGDMEANNLPMRAVDIIEHLIKKHYQPYEFKNGQISKHVMKHNNYAI